jgi:hypothetical protein
MWDRHELGECRLSQEGIVRSLKIGGLELYSLCVEFLLSPEGYRKRYLTDGCHCCTRDYATKRGPTGVQQRLGPPHMVESLQEKNGQGAASIDEDSNELNILDDGADSEWVPPQLRHKVQVISTVEGNGDIGPS